MKAILVGTLIGILFMVVSLSSCSTIQKGISKFKEHCSLNYITKTIECKYIK